MAEDNTGGSYPGMFNFQGIMDQFYNYKPNKEDDFGNAIKNTFASNMIQSAFDKEMSKEMGEFQNALGQSNMEMAAKLELANNSSMMQQEFNYGMQSMGAQFDFQNDFANAQFDRDVAMTAAEGEDTRKTQDNESFNRKQETIVAGEQQRLTDTGRIREQGQQSKELAAVQGGEQRLTDTNKSQLAREELAEQGNQQRATDTNRLRVTGEETRLNTQTQGSEQRATDSNRIKTEGAEQRLNTQTQGSEQRLTDTNRITVTGKEQRATDTNRINTQGDDNRKTMDFGNRLEARTRADQSKYSRNTARSF